MPVSYIICAAGHGRRVEMISKSVAKPLLKIKNRTLLQRSLDSLPLREGDQLIIVHLESVAREELSRGLDASYSKMKIEYVALSEVTRGQLDTALRAVPLIRPQNSVCIFNSDTSFECRRLYESYGDLQWDGLIPCSQEKGDAWSFCQVQDNGEEILLVENVAEKKRISPWCSVGLYWFRSLEVFSQISLQELQEHDSTEVYVAPAYNRMIQRGLRVGMIPVDRFLPMGSVEQIESYWNLSLSEMRLENATHSDG